MSITKHIAQLRVCNIVWQINAQMHNVEEETDQAAIFFFTEVIMRSQRCSQETSLMANIFFESVTVSCESDKYLIFCNSLNVGLHKLTTKLHVYKMTDCNTWKENKLSTEKKSFFQLLYLLWWHQYSR